MKKYRLENGNELFAFEWDYINSNMYVINEGGGAVVIDPILTEETKEFFSQTAPEKIYALLTHEHFDHINGINYLRERFDVTVYCNNECAEKIKNPSKNLSDKSDVIAMFNQNIGERNIIVEPFSCEADIAFSDEFELNLPQNSFYIKTTPGHTAGSVCIILDGKYLFSGDTLLEYDTITRLPGGRKKDFTEYALPYLKSLVGTIQTVYPGHGRTGRLEEFLSKYNCL